MKYALKKQLGVFLKQMFLHQVRYLFRVFACGEITGSKAKDCGSRKHILLA